MDKDFQDRIDDYLLNRMDDAEKVKFLQEVEQDNEKKEQLEFTKNVKDSICSRAKKLQSIKEFQKMYEQRQQNVAATPTTYGKNKKWYWISGIAAAFVVGFFAVVQLINISYKPFLRGAGDNKVLQYKNLPNNSLPGIGTYDSKQFIVDSVSTDTLNTSIPTE
ncbi:MAG: hypothetical protein ACI4E1_01390 [Lachnospira sp.]